MNCSPFELHDYFLGELAENERRQMDHHVRACASCSDELQRLKITQTALMTLREEEIPQRIGFVSDKVFEPGVMGRLWRSFWGSTAQLVFASAAMLSIAIVVHAVRPAERVEANRAEPLSAVVMDRQVAERVQAAVQKAVAESEARQTAKTSELLAAAEVRYQAQHEAEMRNVADAFSVLQKHYNLMVRASNDYVRAR
jgi:Putative zinc-finger